MKFQLVFVFAALTPYLFSQESRFPLESIALEGSAANRDTVLVIAGLKMGAPIDKAKIEEACAKLQDAGVFESIAYRYAPGAKGGIALTLSLRDQTTITAASFDIAGVDESAL